MSRETRLVAALLAISAIGVSGLLIVANKYQKVLVAKPAATTGRGAAMDPSLNAVRLVDGFLAARDGARTFVSNHPAAVERPDAHPDLVEAFRIERTSTLAAHGMTFEEYAAVRAAWRGYRAGRSVGDPALAGVFQAQRAAIDAADLGSGEPFDDAIE